MKSQAFLASLCFILAMGSLIPIMGSVVGSTTAQIILSSNGTIAYPQQLYSFLIEPLDNGSYAAINGTNNQFVSSWTSTNALTVSQNVVNSLASGGSVVWMNGQYNFAGCVNVTVSDVTLSGSGWQTVFSQTSAIVPALFFVTGSNDVIEDMNLSGLQATTSLGIASVPYMSNLDFVDTSNCEALNVYSAFAPAAGIYGRYSTNLLIDSCYAYDNLYNDSDLSGVDPSGYLDGTSGIGGLDLCNSTITNCWVVDQGLGGSARGSGGIELDYNGIIPEGDTISFNHVITSYSFDVTLIAYGIRVKASNCTVIGNQIVLAPSWGEGIDAVYPDTIVQGNTIQSSTTSSTYAINVASTGTSPTITGNIINNTAYGIRSQAPDSTITGNTIYEDATGAGIVLSGTDPQNSAVSANTIVLDSGSGTGIYLATNENSISNNSITGAFSNGIYVTSASNNTIYANSIQNSVTGIYLTTGSNFNTLDLNQINATTSINNFGNGNYQTLDTLNGVPYSDPIISTVTAAENVNVGDSLFQRACVFLN